MIGMGCIGKANLIDVFQLSERNNKKKRNEQIRSKVQEWNIWNYIRWNIQCLVKAWMDPGAH